jgi:hypothetical protein
LLVIVISLGESGAPTASQGLFIHESEQPFPRRDLKVEYQGGDDEENENHNYNTRGKTQPVDERAQSPASTTC